MVWIPGILLWKGLGFLGVAWFESHSLEPHTNDLEPHTKNNQLVPIPLSYWFYILGVFRGPQQSRPKTAQKQVCNIITFIVVNTYNLIIHKTKKTVTFLIPYINQKKENMVFHLTSMFFPTHCSSSHFHRGASLCALEIQWTNKLHKEQPLTIPSRRHVTEGGRVVQEIFSKTSLFFVKGTQFCFCSGKKDLAPGNSANVTFFGMVSSRAFPFFWGS